ncbi:MAG: hypothetical protein QNJ32_22230 [Xenococcaceae cyanobacterium MO_167.B27]|nr:hypothetical protein [Xenococcaceae cyanobacterium MO_167.B27]
MTRKCHVPFCRAVGGVTLSLTLIFGLKTFLTVSDGTPIKSPLFFNQFRSLLRKANKNLSSKLTLPMGRGRKSLFFKLDLDFIPGAVSLVWNSGERTSY